VRYDREFQAEVHIFEDPLGLLQPAVPFGNSSLANVSSGNYLILGEQMNMLWD
jgi:hypothetical protein